jgi:transcription initiation factor TFIID subunit TAF12
MEKIEYKSFTIEVKDGKVTTFRPWLGFFNGFWGTHIRKQAEYDSVAEAKEAIDEEIELEEFLESAYND